MAAPPAQLNLSRLKQHLVVDEGVRTTAYVDSTGHITAGVGHNLQARPISQAIIQEWLDEDIADTIQQLDDKLPWWRQLNPVRQEALVNMTFNLGIGGVLEFTHMLSALQRGLYVAAKSYALDSAWAKQVGSRAQRIATMFETGEPCGSG